MQLRVKNEITVPGNVIDNGAMDRIRKLVRDQLDVSLPYDNYCGFWEYIDENGVQFVKRLRNWLHFYHPQKKLSNDCWGVIGSTAAQAISQEVTFCYDFTGRFNWSAGKFGDHGSCYWGDRSRAKEVLEEAGCLAIRFYIKEEDSYHGDARAWVFPVDDVWIVFNGYGMNTVEIARIMSYIVGGTYKNINLDNNGDCEGLIYINFGSGYVVGPRESVEEFGNSFDLGLDDDWNQYECRNCGDGLSEDDVYTGDDNDHYCGDCYREFYKSCCKCWHDSIWHEDATEVDGEWYCCSCRDKYLTRCDVCDDYFETDDIVSSEDGVSWCNKCWENEDEYFECSNCACIHHHTDMEKDGETWYCKQCFPSDGIDYAKLEQNGQQKFAV